MSASSKKTPRLLRINIYSHRLHCHFAPLYLPQDELIEPALDLKDLLDIISALPKSRDRHKSFDDIKIRFHGVYVRYKNNRLRSDHFSSLLWFHQLFACTNFDYLLPNLSLLLSKVLWMKMGSSTPPTHSPSIWPWSSKAPVILLLHRNSRSYFGSLPRSFLETRPGVQDHKDPEAKSTSWNWWTVYDFVSRGRISASCPVYNDYKVQTGDESLFECYRARLIKPGDML